MYAKTKPTIPIIIIELLSNLKPIRYYSSDNMSLIKAIADAQAKQIATFKGSPAFFSSTKLIKKAEAKKDNERHARIANDKSLPNDELILLSMI